MRSSHLDRRALVGLASVVAALGLAACGSSGSSGTTGTSNSGPLSLSAFETKANGICSSANAASHAVPKPTSAADVKRYVDADFPIVEKAAKQLQALTPPPSEASAYQQYISAVNQQLALLRQAKADVDRGDINSAIALANSTGQSIKTKAHAAALAAHLSQCAK